MTDDSSGASKSLLESLGALASTLVSAAHTRLELLSTDLEEDRTHLITIVSLYIIALFCLVAGLVLAAIFIVVAFWESYRLLALGLLALFFLLTSLIAFGFAKHTVKSKPKLFLASLLELLKDKNELDSR